MPSDRIGHASRRHGIVCRAALLLLSGLLATAPAPAARAQETAIISSPSDTRFASHIAEASLRFRIPEHWIRAVLAAESARNIRAVSSAGAMGLMQVMSDTWAELRARHRLDNDPLDPRDNILAGTAYLREMLDRHGSIGGMLAAYNAGPGRYDEYLATGRPLPAETRDYVAALAPILGGDPLPDSAAAAAPGPADWREAPLFIAPPADSSPAGSPQPGTSATAGWAQRDDATPPSSEDIFVVRSEPGAPQ